MNEGSDVGCLSVPKPILDAAVSGNQRPLMEWMKGERVVEAPVKSQVDEDMERVLEAHTERFWNGKGQRPSMTPTKRRLIKRALTSEKYSVEQLITIFDEVLKDDWYCGRGNSPRKFTGIEDIFRWDGRLDRFLDRAVERANEPQSTLEEREKQWQKIKAVSEKVKCGTASLAEKDRWLKSIKDFEQKWGMTWDKRDQTFN